MNTLHRLKATAREYQSARDRKTLTMGDAVACAEAAVAYLADRQRRRRKENARRGIGPDDVKRLRAKAGKGGDDGR